MIRSMARAFLSIHLLWLLVLSVVASGCAAPLISLPSAEVERLLALPPSASGLTPDQSTTLRSLLETSTSNRRVLELHLAEESLRLKRLLGDGEPMVGPAIWTQAGLVYQLRMEQLLGPALLRERTRQLLTTEQQMWWARNRLKLIFPP
jgi:hypothetical protein